MRATDTLHRLPTHLGVRDPVLWRLDDVQLVKVAAGVLVAAFILRQATVPFGIRLALMTVALLGAAACALIRIDGRSLDEWLLLAGRYWSRPRTLVWRSRRPDHPWAQTLGACGPRRHVSGARYRMRHIRLDWPEPVLRTREVAR